MRRRSLALLGAALTVPKVAAPPPMAANYPPDLYVVGRAMRLDLSAFRADWDRASYSDAKPVNAAWAGGDTAPARMLAQVVADDRPAPWGWHELENVR